MSNSRLKQEESLLGQARNLRRQIQQNISAHRFPDDDLHMRTYNDLIVAASELFLTDPILNGQMVKMPDAVVQAYSPEYGGWFPLGAMPPELPSQRTEQHLTRLVNRLELLLGEEYHTLVSKFNRLRRKRHDFIYDSKNHTTYQEAKASLETAKKLIDEIIVLIKEESPEKDLFK